MIPHLSRVLLSTSKHDHLLLNGRSIDRQMDYQYTRVEQIQDENKKNTK